MGVHPSASMSREPEGRFMDKTSPKPKWPRPLDTFRASLPVTLGLGLFVFLTRLPALLAYRAIDDEQVYAVVANEMVHGGRPYIDAIERKPPLLFVLYQQIFDLAGSYNWLAVHLVMVFWTLATMLVLYGIARRLFDRTTGFWAAGLYGLFFLWADYRNLALNGELLMNLPVTAAVAVAFWRGRSRVRPELVLAGALVALAFLLKQPAGIAALAVGLYLLVRGYGGGERRLPWGYPLLHGALLTLGFAAVLGGTALWLWHEGILREALYWTILNHDLPYGPATWKFWQGALERGGFFLLATLPLQLGALESIRRGLKGGTLWEDRRPEFIGLLLLFGVSLIGVSASGQFLYHYFLQLLPPLVLLAAPVFTEFWGAAGSVPPGRLGRRILGGWLALSAVAFLVVDTAGVIRHDQPGEAGVYVLKHSDPQDRIFVWGQGDRYTGLYLDAQRRPAARYIASYPLTGHIFGVWKLNLDTSSRVVPGAWDALWADFAAHPPRFIIDTDGILQPVTYPITHYPALLDYVRRNYRLVFRAHDGTVFERIPRTTGPKR
jgi:Dolichyl-phosphate-mannose-protein mannosyltransferase